MKGFIYSRSQYFNKSKEPSLAKIAKEKPFLVAKGTVRKLCGINGRAYHENLAKSFQITIEGMFFGLVYFWFAYNLFNYIWYLKLLSVVSGLLFVKLYIDVRIELVLAKVLKDIPKTFRKVTHYLVSNDGNILKALEKTEPIAPATTRPIISKTIVALKSENPEKQIKKLSEQTSLRWVRMFYELCLYGKRCGEQKGENKNVFTGSIKKLTQIASFVNLNKGEDVTELLWMQLFAFLLPIISIPAVQSYYAYTNLEISDTSVYASLAAQTLAAQIFIVSNLATIFINWVRKDG